MENTVELVKTAKSGILWASIWIPLDILNFVSTKNMILNSSWWILWVTYLFYQKRVGLYICFY